MLLLDEYIVCTTYLIGRVFTFLDADCAGDTLFILFTGLRQMGMFKVMKRIRRSAKPPKNRSWITLQDIVFDQTWIIAASILHIAFHVEMFSRNTPYLFTEETHSAMNVRHLPSSLNDHYITAFINDFWRKGFE